MDFASLTHDYHDAGWATYNAMCRADDWQAREDALWAAYEATLTDADLYEAAAAELWDRHVAERLRVAADRVAARYPNVSAAVGRIHARAVYSASEKDFVRAWEAKLARATAQRRADLERQRRALVPVEDAPCRAIVPVAHYVFPYLTPQRTIVFSCAGVADSAPTPDGAAWEALFLEV